ncbi:MAG TPA: hypothetical protein DCS93_01015 [Microscillaceae bacterium]|nr:hypothetical protein [Microscillaceae bacterium]
MINKEQKDSPEAQTDGRARMSLSQVIFYPFMWLPRKIRSWKQARKYKLIAPIGTVTSIPIGIISKNFSLNGYGLPNKEYSGWVLCQGQAADIPNMTRFNDVKDLSPGHHTTYIMYIGEEEGWRNHLPWNK